MNMRFFILPTTLGAILFISGCSAPAEITSTTDVVTSSRVHKSDLPIAPPPHVKKTTAELLVGKWQLVAFENGPVHPQLEFIFEYKDDGLFVIASTDPKHGFQMNSGSYVIDGNMIHFTSAVKFDAIGLGECWSVKIKSVSDDKMVVIDESFGGTQAAIVKRIKDN